MSHVSPQWGMRVLTHDHTLAVIISNYCVGFFDVEQKDRDTGRSSGSSTSDLCLPGDVELPHTDRLPLRKGCLSCKVSKLWTIKPVEDMDSD